MSDFTLGKYGGATACPECAATILVHIERDTADRVRSLSLSRECEKECAAELFYAFDTVRIPVPRECKRIEMEIAESE